MLNGILLLLNVSFFLLLRTVVKWHLLQMIIIDEPISESKLVKTVDIQCKFSPYVLYAKFVSPGSVIYSQLYDNWWPSPRPLYAIWVSLASVACSQWYDNLTFTGAIYK